MNESRLTTIVGGTAVALGATLAGCSLLLGENKDFKDLDATGSTSGEDASSAGGAGGKSASSAGGAVSSTGSGAGQGGGSASGSSGQSTGAGGCSSGQGGCGSSASSGASSSSAASSSAASSSASTGTGGTAPCGGANALDTLTDTFTGTTLDPAKWGQYVDGMGSSVNQANNQLAIFDLGPTGTDAGIFSQGGYSLKGCSASIKVLDAPKIDGIAVLFLLSSKANTAYELSFVQSGIYLDLEVHDPGGVKAAGQVMFTKGVQVYWRFREAPDSGGTVYWETSTTGASWTQAFSYPTANLGFGITNLEINIGTSGSGASGTTVHYDNFNVVP